MDIQTEKQDLIEWISNLEDESIIEDIKMLKENSINGIDWWDELTDAQKKSIERGLKDAEEGRVVPFNHVKKMIAEWLTKKSFPMKPFYIFKKI